MKTYTAEEPIMIREGNVVITDEQALWRLRSRNIEATDDEGVYSVVGHVQFKAGESFGWDGEPPKAERHFVREVAPAAQAEAEAQA